MILFCARIWKPSVSKSFIFTKMVTSKPTDQPEPFRTLLPYFSYGKVVKGFGRGSRDLGCPTANMSDQVVSGLPETLPCGVYYGFASVDNGPVFRMVTSVGWNPHFNNTKKTIEVHLMHDYGKDFYGSLLKVILLGYLRPMTSFSSLDALKEAIRSDIVDANRLLDCPEFQAHLTHNFFTVGGEKLIPNARKISDIIPDPKNNGGSTGNAVGKTMN